jgi:protein O-mannosyl-transferase
VSDAPPRPADRRLLLAVAATALIVYAGALWNGYALDDVLVIASNPLTHRLSGVWQAFWEPYWPAAFGAAMYRPLPIASFALDLQVDHVVWLHLVNLLWHAAVSVLVAFTTRKWTGSDTAAWLAGLLFAVHPVHVEAVANLVGRTELMAALFTILSVSAALALDRPVWSLAALALGLLSKENAAIAPALIGWGWLLGLGRPTWRRARAYVGGWAVLGIAYLIVRWGVLHPYERLHHVAAVFVGAGAGAIRLTAVAAIGDVVRLFVFPLTLRADYSPAERTLVTSPIDARFLVGVICLLVWGGLVWLAWRRGRPIVAFGLGWVAIAVLPVANLIFPTGVLVAERTLYLPSAGLALAFGAVLARLPRPRAILLAAAVVGLGGLRTALRVPVWRSTLTVTMSVLDDSPRSYFGPAQMIGIYLQAHRPDAALDAFRRSVTLYDRVPPVYMLGADAAFKLDRPQLADSLLRRMERLCERCRYYYQSEAATALARGDTTVADSLLGRLRGVEAAPSP